MFLKTFFPLSDVCQNVEKSSFFYLKMFCWRKLRACLLMHKKLCMLCMKHSHMCLENWRWCYKKLLHNVQLCNLMFVSKFNFSLCGLIFLDICSFHCFSSYLYIIHIISNGKFLTSNKHTMCIDQTSVIVQDFNNL